MPIRGVYLQGFEVVDAYLGVQPCFVEGGGPLFLLHVLRLELMIRRRYWN